MSGLWLSERHAGDERAPQSITGIGAIAQKTQLKPGRGRGGVMSLLAALVLAAGLGAALVTAAAPDALALDPYSRGVQSRTAPAPLPRMQPAPPKVFTTKPPLNPSLKSPSLNNPSTDFNRRAAESANCRSRCGTSCQTMSCSGLDTSTCLRIRQQCRMSCSTSC